MRLLTDLNFSCASAMLTLRRLPPRPSPTALASSHFLQAHSLLNLQLIHSDPAHASPGFEIYSSLKQVSPHAAPSPFTGGQGDDADGAEGQGGGEFSTKDLLSVMSRLAWPPHPSSQGAAAAVTEDPPVTHLQYFPLCRELGARSVDGMVRGRILELRWSRTVTPENEDARFAGAGGGGKATGAESRGVLGPVVVPTTPVVRRAMREVLEEYEEEGRWPVPEKSADKEEGH